MTHQVMTAWTSPCIKTRQFPQRERRGSRLRPNACRSRRRRGEGRRLSRVLPRGPPRCSPGRSSHRPCLDSGPRGEWIRCRAARASAIETSVRFTDIGVTPVMWEGVHLNSHCTLIDLAAPTLLSGWRVTKVIHAERRGKVIGLDSPRLGWDDRSGAACVSTGGAGNSVGRSGPQPCPRE
jgi:hypothetical protein